jgi:hypothetical protein
MYEGRIAGSVRSEEADAAKLGLMMAGVQAPSMPASAGNRP